MTLTDPENAAHDRTINDDIDAITASDSEYPYTQDDRTADELARHKETYPWLYNEAGAYDPRFQDRPELQERKLGPLQTLSMNPPECVLPVNTMVHIENAEVREAMERQGAHIDKHLEDCDLCTPLNNDSSYDPPMPSREAFPEAYAAVKPQHMTQAEALDHQTAMFVDALEIMKKKRFDYSGTVDPFKNLRDAAFVGVDPLQGVMVRIMDKFARIRSFIQEGTLKVNDESVRDTLVDVLNYTCILAAMIDEGSDE